MTSATAVAPSTAPPAQQLAGFLARFDPSIVKTVRAGRVKLRKLLRGSGNRGRFLMLSPDAAELNTSEVRALLRAAVKEDDVPLPWSAHPTLVIKSVSRKQRPRRPSVRSTR